MADGSGSVTLIFYRVGKEWWKEPALNLLAAAAQRSAYTHVELAIGEDALDDGSMTNVVRIFNDPVGAVRYVSSNTCAICFLLHLTLRTALTGSHKPHGPQPAVLVRVAGLLEECGAADARVCTTANWQALFQCGDGAVADLAAANRRNLVVLRRCATIFAIFLSRPPPSGTCSRS